MARHTPAPIEVLATYSPDGQTAFVVCDPVRHLGDDPTPEQIASVDEANRRLFEVAPELLKALAKIRDARDHHAEHGEYPDDVGPCFDDWAADVAEAAITKARG